MAGAALLRAAEAITKSARSAGKCVAQ